MPTTYEGTLQTPQGRFALIAARFNRFIVQQLVDGAVDGLVRSGVPDSAIDLVWVPGSFEIPAIAQQLAETNRYTALICLGAVIRGETSHYDHVAGAAANGIAHVSLSAKIPVLFGVLTCDTLDQAINRAGAKAGNKGYEAAIAAIEMVNLRQVLPQRIEPK
jgi:6,7-dimethyl-8-ribityllumazine synthase